MKPAKFHYLRPSTTEEALELLWKYGDEAKIMSGGQSLIPLLNMRLSAPDYLIDLNMVEELKYIRPGDGTVHIGTLTRQADIERSSLIKQSCPILQEATSFIGHKQIRNRGTVGGSIAHADPSAELPCVLSALRGKIVIASLEEERTVAPEEFFLTYLLTAMEPTEMVKEVQFPVLSKTSGYAFVELSRREGDFALVAVASVLDLDDDGVISLSRLAIGGANPVPVALEEVETFLTGQLPSKALFEEAAEKVKECIDPEDDMHGSSDYRRQLASVLTLRALNIALERTTKEVQL